MRVLVKYIFVIILFNDFCLFENGTSLDFQNFGINYNLEIDEIANFDINLDFLNDINFCENDANCTNLVTSILLDILIIFLKQK
jgi:hypothetical protein